ncbi:hypothetical protein KALB_2149 [Kutzneria albida DSM 43870]|uniref:DUF4865 domain-containing protein n=2 Tax=Kutzneria TaxID=43356 RepID=W5W2U6_9PSEU|nr:hypothetical protein KALB_2149 [Kutzneria albida DSM 43870]
MHAMQYEITLPADYDMGIIRRRVADKGPLLDNFPGLGLKAYCVRERDSSPVNQYAPFYLWHNTSGMSRFLVGGSGFRSIIDSFGRPVVRHWVGAGFQRGPAFGAKAVAASKQLTAIPAEADPEAVTELALAELRARTSDPAVLCGAVAIDPSSWELVHFTLCAEPVEGGYQVLHLSCPELAELAEGRSW